MDLRIIKGTSMLDTKALMAGDQVYLPAEALEGSIGFWKGETVFYNSPLAGKRICVAFLSPDTSDRLPPALEDFLALCAAAQAQIIYHDGGVFPQGDLILAIEPGGRHVLVNSLGSGFNNKPLANRITSTLKRGLKLAYLPDPVTFHKPQYNLKLKLWAKLFTPAIAIQWPDNHDRIGPWLFTSLMEFFGSGAEIDGELFCEDKLASQGNTDLVESIQEWTPPHVEQIPLESNPGKSKLSLESTRATVRPINRSSAGMSRAQYPDFFANLELKQKKVPKKEPFS